MFCENCGKLLADGTKFCENCGTPVVASEPEVKDAAEQVTPSVLAMSAEPVSSDLDEVKAKAQETQAKQDAQPAQPVIVQPVQPQPIQQPIQQPTYQQPVQPQVGYQQPMQPTYQQPSYQQTSYQSQPAYQTSATAMASNDGKGGAIAATVLGGVSIFFDLIFYTAPLGMILGIIGLILSLMSRKKGYKHGCSTPGLVLSIIGLAIGALLSLIFFIVVIAAIADSL